MVTIKTYTSRGEWLAARKSCIGGSDAACILGLNPWKSNIELWEEKTGRRKAVDISDNPLVEYGTKAEESLRELFRLDFPELAVGYEPWAMFTNTDYPFAHASLDGWLTDPEGRRGVLEIKTATISSKAQADKWKDGIPQNYYCQLLHYFMVTGYDFAILKAQLKYDWTPKGLPMCKTQHYRIERIEVEEEIAYLAEREAAFAAQIKADRRPATILPEI